MQNNHLFANILIVEKLNSLLKQLLSINNVFLLLIAAFHAVLNIVWHKLNTAPPTWDSAGHLGLSFLFADKMPALLLGDISLVDFLKVSNYYPPLVQYLGGLLILTFGRSYFSAIFIGTMFFVISIIFLYKIIMHYFQDTHLAALAVFIYSLFPHVWEQSRQFHLDVPLVALLLISYYCLITSNSLKNTKSSLLFFVFFTLAQLTKWYGFVYLVVPFIYDVLVKAYVAMDFFNRDRIANVVRGAVIIVVFALPWYVFNYANIIDIVGITSLGEAGDPENVWSFESLFHYLKLIMSHQISFVAVILLFFSIYMFNKRKVVFKDILFQMMALPYAVFTLIQNKDLRYVLPLTPIFAFYIAYTLLKLEFRWSKYLRNAFVIYLMTLFFFMSFNQFQRLPDRLKPLAYIIGGPYYHGWYYEPYSYAANMSDWKNNQIILDIANTAKEDSLISRRYRVLEISDNRYYSLASFELFRRQNNIEEMEIVVPYFQFQPFTPEQLREYLLNINFALVPIIPGPSGLRNIAVLNQLRDYFESSGNTDFVAIKTYNMPDGNTLTLYKRNNFLSYTSPDIREDSLKISVGNVLFIDRSKTGGLSFEVTLYDKNGSESVLKISGGGSQRRIRLDSITSFSISLDNQQQDVRELRGWEFNNGVYTKNLGFDQIIKESGNEYVYENLRVVPRSEYRIIGYVPKNVIKFMPANGSGKAETIVVSREKPDLGEKIFVAYATTGWQWHNIWLEGDTNFLEVPTAGLLQLEVSQKSQLIVGFPSDWGFFPCYEGRAVCYYPPVEGL